MDHTTRRKIEFLDRYIPLQGVSHAEVTGYTVDISLRYAECRAELCCGLTAQLKNKQQFIGRSCEQTDAAWLFNADGRLVVLRTTSGLNAPRSRRRQTQKFIGVDGDLIELSRWGVTEIDLVPVSQPHIPMHEPKFAAGALI